MRWNNTREPLKKLSNKQVYNICIDEAHCKQDLSDNRPLLRKQALKKPSLKKLDLPNRERYINEILRLPPQNTLLIYTNETPITFRGSQHRRVTTLRGVAVYIKMEKPYFTHIQWAVACANTCVLWPYTVWKTKNEKKINELKAKLNNKIQLLANLVNKQQLNVSISGTLEYKYIKMKQVKINIYNTE